MPTTSQTRSEDSSRSIQDSVRNWDLDTNALAVVAFPFTSRRIPRSSKRAEAR